MFVSSIYSVTTTTQSVVQCVTFTILYYNVTCNNLPSVKHFDSIDICFLYNDVKENTILSSANLKKKFFIYLFFDKKNTIEDIVILLYILSK